MSDKQAIKAYVRVRPFTAREMVAKPQPCIKPHKNAIMIEQEVVAQAEADSGRAGSPRNERGGGGNLDQTQHNLTFDFDGVFWSVPPNQVLSETEAQDEFYLSALPPFADQERLFQEVGVPAVDSLLKGFPVTIFAYGQTGSGKSHTIFGPVTDAGLSPKMAGEIFRTLDEEKPFGWKAEVALSCFEIYNEKVTDLLGKAAPPGRGSPKSVRRARGMSMSMGRKVTFPNCQDDNGDLPEATMSHSGVETLTNTTSRTLEMSQQSGVSPYSPRSQAEEDGVVEDSTEISSNTEAASNHETSSHTQNSHSAPSRSPFDAEQRELKVRQHPDLGVFVEGLRKEQVGDAHQLTAAIHTALSHRVTAATRMNDTSSRSHAVIQVSVDIRDEVQGKRRAAVMNIIDLAGSERISRSGVTGQQLNEAKNINLSLTTLRRVIDVITENMDRKKNKQVPPFRESTLTWILMDCFGGSAVTVMLATVSPHIDNITDTVSTMRYATKCKTIVNTVRANESKIAVTIAAINAESERLRKSIREVTDEKVDFDTMIKQEKAKIQRKQNVLKAVIRPACDRMKKGMEEAEHRLAEATTALEGCQVRIVAKEKQVVCREELERLLALIAATKAEEEKEYRLFRRVEDDLAARKQDLNALLHIEPSDAASTFKRMRRTAIRRQIIMYAQEQRDKPIIERMKADNEAMLDRIEALHETIAELSSNIVEESMQVYIASEPERVKDAVAKDFSNALEDISASMEGYRQATGEHHRKANALMRDIAATEASIAADSEQMAQWEAFHGEVRAQLQRDIKDVTRRARLLSEEADALASDYVSVVQRRKAAGDDTVMLKESIRLERACLREQEARLASVRADVVGSVNQLREDDETKANLTADASNEATLAEQLEKECAAVTASIQGAEAAIRTKCFPDAPAVYGNKVLARMAVDLDAAAAVTPKQLERIRHAASPTLYVASGPSPTRSRRDDPNAGL